MKPFGKLHREPVSRGNAHRAKFLKQLLGFIKRQQAQARSKTSAPRGAGFALPLLRRAARGPTPPRRLRSCSAGQKPIVFICVFGAKLLSIVATWCANRELSCSLSSKPSVRK